MEVLGTNSPGQMMKGQPKKMRTEPTMMKG
jgi:hypothetical protein